MRTTVRIDDDLYRRAEARAAENGQTVGQLVEDALREALRSERRTSVEPPPLPTYGAGGLFPGIDPSDGAALADRLDDGASIDARR